MTKCFLVTQTYRCTMGLRRLAWGKDGVPACPLDKGGTHIARVALSERGEWQRRPWETGGYVSELLAKYKERYALASCELWPTACACGYRFTETDYATVDWDAIMVADNGKEYSHKDYVPGMMWYRPEYYDPEDKSDTAKRETVLAKIRSGEYGGTNFFLSRFYWENWSDKRPPISVICPSAHAHIKPHEWTIDAKSSNGEGWTVSGDAPLITCAPSIKLPGYHGFLQNGVFTAPLGDS